LIQIQVYFFALHELTQRNVYLKLAHDLSVGMQKYRWWRSRRSPRPPSRTLRRSSGFQWSNYGHLNRVGLAQIKRLHFTFLLV